MKKALSFIMCYALGMVASVLDATAAVSSADFSDQGQWGKTPEFMVEGELSTFWNYYGSYGNLSVVTNYAEAESRYTAFASPSNVQPEYMKSGDKNTGLVEFLGLEPLIRSFLTLDKKEGQLRHQAVEIPSDNDLFVDMLVEFVPRFEAADAVPTSDVEGMAKFMCWLSSPAGSTETNFIVTAGYYGADGSLYRTNYVTSAKVEAGRWYRLTARAIANAASKSGARETGFALYLDGEQVVCDAGRYVIGADAKKLKELFDGNEHFERCGLFPPARTVSEPALHGVAVQGCGRFDELGVVNDSNPLIGSEGCEQIDVAVVIDPAVVTNVVCAVFHGDEAEPYFTTNTVGVAQTAFRVWTNDVIRVLGDVRRGHTMLPSLAVAGNAGAVASLDGYSVTLRPTFTDIGKLVLRINTSAEPFEVNGVTYKTIEAALEAASVLPEPKVTLFDNVVLDPETDNGQMRILPKYRNILFDLYGSTIKGVHFQDESTIYVQGQLTIIDSVGGGGIEAPGTVIEVDISTNDAIVLNHAYAALQLGSEEYYDTGFSVSGRVRVARGTKLDIRGGTYLSPSDVADRADRFYLADYVDKARFKCTRLDETGDHWQVTWDNFWTVRFEVEHGTVVPAVTNVLKGTRLVRPTVTAAGYVTESDWYDKSTSAQWNFDDVVTGDLVLTARQSFEEYTITYDPSQESAPKSYTLGSTRRILPVLSRTLFTFNGWRDAGTGRFVSHVGKDAVFVGTEIPVSGNLNLTAEWSPVGVSWSNAASANSESNGTYAGSWELSIPVGDGIATGSAFVIDEIDFCIVNPNLYPKTSEYLAVKPQGGTTVVSRPRAYAVDEATGEYLVTAADRLANGRPKVAYVFDGLVVTAGPAHEAFFCTKDGAAVSGFLRLKYNAEGKSFLLGNCQRAGGTPESEEYRKYCPVYELRGHLKGDNE